MSKLLNTLLILSVFLTLETCEAGNETGFKDGRHAVTEGRYAEATLLLEQYITANPKGKNSSRAQFFIAKAEIGQGNYDKARFAFEKTISQYPNSLEAHKSLYKIAIIDMIQGRTVQAIEAFEKLAAKPNGPLAPEAKAMAEFLSK